MFLVRPGVPLRSELDHRLDVVRHGRGSWIPAAPSRMPEGPVRWAVAPDRTQWQLPGAESVQALLVDALGTAHTPPPDRAAAAVHRPARGLRTQLTTDTDVPPTAESLTL